MISVGTRSSGEACLAVVVSTDRRSSEVAKGPQPSLKNCRNRRGKVEGKTHTHSRTDMWRRERGMSETSDFPKKPEGAPGGEGCSPEDLAEQRRQNEGIHWLILLWHWSQLWMLLVKSHGSTCERKARCSRRKALHASCAGD